MNLIEYSGNYVTYYGGDITIWKDGNSKVLGSNHCYSKEKRSDLQGSISISVEPGSVIGINTESYSGGYISITTTRRTINITSQKKFNCSIFFDEEISTPVLERTGYNFGGWYDENDFRMTENWLYTENKTFYAKWEAKTYTIDYVLDGGENNISNLSGYTIESNIALLNPCKQGHTFVGWYLDENFIDRIDTISNRTGNITLYAKYNVNTYNSSLDASGGHFAPKVEFVSDGIIIKAEYLHSEEIIEKYYPNNKDGYIFGGWYTDTNYSSVFNFDTTITEDIKLYAKWIETSANTINIETVSTPVKIVVNGKNEILYEFIPICNATITITSVSSLDLIGKLYDGNKNVLIMSDDIDEKNLNFSYTYNVYAGQIYYIGVRGNTVATIGTVDITIEWTGNAKITGTTYAERTNSFVYGTEYTLPDNVEKEGYTFVGWYDDNSVKFESGTWNYTTNLSLHAVFQKDE